MQQGSICGRFDERDRRLLIPPSLGVACSTLRQSFTDVLLQPAASLRHSPPALERPTSGSETPGKSYLTVTYLTLPNFLSTSFAPILINLSVHQFAFQLPAALPRSQPRICSITSAYPHYTRLKREARCMEAGCHSVSQ